MRKGGKRKEGMRKGEKGGKEGIRKGEMEKRRN
jgi:hypothetical protein